MTINEAILIAHGLVSTVYGFGEHRCGDVGHTRACDNTAITASGETFDPTQPTMAVAAPFDQPIEARWMYIKTRTSPCVRVRLNDKLNPRYIGKRGFDLSPATVVLLTGKTATQTWSDQVYLCKPHPTADRRWNVHPAFHNIIDAIH